MIYDIVQNETLTQMHKSTSSLAPEYPCKSFKKSAQNALRLTNTTLNLTWVFLYENITNTHRQISIFSWAYDVESIKLGCQIFAVSSYLQKGLN